MAKFYVTFLLLAFVALENHHSLGGHAHPSQPTGGSSVERHQSIYPHHRSHQLAQRHKTAEQQRWEFLQRHQAEIEGNHQRHNQQRHETPPADARLRTRRRKHLEEELKAMPRIWQHLQQQQTRDELMFGDGPIDTLHAIDSGEQAFAKQPQQPDYAHMLMMRTMFSSNDGDSWEEELQPLQPLPPQQELPAVEEEVAPVQEQQLAELPAVSAEQQQEAPVASTTALPPGCPKCENDRRVAHVTEEELTSLRIEFVKQQILEKLRLKERPNVSPVRLPKPIYEGATIGRGDETAQNKDLDDYYARTSKKFIFLEREQTECQRLGAPSMCFSFKIDDADVDSFDVNTAVLWIFKNKQKKAAAVAAAAATQQQQQQQQQQRNSTTLVAPQTIVVAEVQQQSESQYLPVVKTIAIQTVDVQDEWMKIDIVWPIKRWFGNHELSHLIHISCQSCDIDSMDEMISVDKDYRPFIMVDTQNRRRAQRQKRSINCTGGVTECCREKLYISFDDIGWGDWIIQPRGYDAYFCRGTCATLASVAQSDTYHNTFVQRHAVAQRSKGRKSLELIPCCTAKQYSSLQLVFMDGNNTATLKTFPKMVVEECGCR